MKIIEIFDTGTKYVPAVRVKQGNHTYVREDLVDKVLAEKDKEIRKQVCEEIYNFIMSNWEELMGMQGRWQNFNGTCLDLKEDLEKIAENGYKKGE